MAALCGSGIRLARLPGPLAIVFLLSAALAIPARSAAGRPERLVLRLPAGVEPVPLSPYAALGAGTASRPDAGPAAAPLRLPGAPGLEGSLAAAGASTAACLADGLADAPPAWRRTYVVELPGASSAETRALAQRLAAAGLVEAAVRDPEYLPLVVKDFDWSAGPGAAAAGRSPEGRPAAGARRPVSAALAAARSGFFPDDSLFVSGAQWSLYNTGLGPFGGAADVDVRAPEAWAITTGRSSTVLGVVDTGIDPAHPELNRLLADGSPRLAAALSAHDPLESPADSVGHGTMVCGVAAAFTNNGVRLGGLGVAGVAGGDGPDSAGVRLVSVKATQGHSGEASGTDLARAILLAYEAGARAINVSFGGDDPSPMVRDALQYVTDRGTTVVFGAGNSTDSRPQYPGWYATLGVAVSVGAVDESGELAVFSTYGDQVDVVAPGVDIWSTWPTYANGAGSSLRNFAHTSGTSFSAPLVTGIAGLAYGLQPDLEGNDFREMVRRSARDWGQPGRDLFFGSGLADGAALLGRLVPPWAVRHGSAGAASWASAGMESVRVTASGIVRWGHSVDGDYLAERFTVRATAGLGRDLLDVPEVWVRPSGPGGWAAGREHQADIPWGEAVSGTVSRTRAELVTNVYRIDAPPPGCSLCPPVGWLPRPPEQVVMAWSAWSRLDGPPTVRIVRPAAGDEWPAGSTQTVEWAASDPDTVTDVRVVWLPDGLAPAVELGSSSAAAGSLTVVAPCRPPTGQGTLVVEALDESGHVDESETSVAVGITGDACPSAAGAPLALDPPAPNPARGSVTLRVRGAGAPVGPGGTVPGLRLVVLDLRGRIVRHLAPIAGPESAEVQWDGRTDGGLRAPSGVYVVRAEDGGRSVSRRLVWLDLAGGAAP